MNDEQARLFVALELPDGARSALLQWREAVVAGRPGMRPVAREALHVTLCFLGGRPVSEIKAIAAACGVVADGPELELSLAGAVWLPPRRPSVLAVKLEDPAGGLARAQSRLSEALHAGGWYLPESRPFLAHVTVTRVARGVRVRRTDLPAPPPLQMQGSTITLFRSRLGPAGAQYEPLCSVQLRSGMVSAHQRRDRARKDRAVR